jgi:2-phospho-L-lactate transferase/gluconeogenesis factor (CofD/UPF0052 family)
MNRKGQTTGFTVNSYLEEMSRFIGTDIFDYILVNNQSPPKHLVEIYAEEGDLVKNDLQSDERVIAAPLLGEFKKGAKVDLIKRSLIRHDSKKLAQELMQIVNHI